MSRADLEVFVSDHADGTTVVTLAGPVDSMTVEPFRQKLQAACSRPGARIILDCSRLSYLNSRAIGLLNAYRRQLIFTRGALVICGLNPKLVRTLDLLGLGQAMPMYPDRDAAVSAMASMS